MLGDFSRLQEVIITIENKIKSFRNKNYYMEEKKTGKKI
jgi:hypothetical protein